MTKKFCDKCKTDITNEHQVIIFKEFEKDISKEAELCVSCYRDLDSAIKNFLR